ncbi:hypothetical protein [Rhizobium sp. UGM030330-04]|uniref:hypothetical protein n=1 Tax=Rhizobium sp. UGM030330-04 TaxID=1378077 RepID=UPI000D8E89A3|nr:hypothetical protein [Rhizobium sp. UGM030330-04]PYG53688.1 hypothetical protein N434_04851 [Rhizobium sp. UGM030330-04]
MLRKAAQNFEDSIDKSTVAETIAAITRGITNQAKALVAAATGFEESATALAEAGLADLASAVEDIAAKMSKDILDPVIALIDAQFAHIGV